MKLIIQQGPHCKSQNIEEYEMEKYLKMIITDYSGKRITPLNYEIARFRIPHGVAVIFHDNRKLRTRNYWYEVRGLAVLAHHLNLKFYHSVQMRFNDGQTTEIDGLDIESKSVMVELKQQTINQEWITFFAKKQKRLGLKECFIGAPEFVDNLQIPLGLKCFKINLDHHTLFNYYKNDFQLPNWFEPYIPNRHVRILLNNGLWSGIKRKLTWTAKHTPSTKVKQSIRYLFKRGKVPIRLYYSLSRMAIPQRDYFGKGYPIPFIIAAFDVDSDHKPHEIGKEGYCLKCLEEARYKRDLLYEKLTELGWRTRIIHSGFKGYHIYCLNELDKPVELTVKDIQELLPKLRDESGNPLTDNENFRDQDNSFDLHRIFKLPNSVDTVTGIRVTEKLQRLSFDDKIQALN